MPASGNIHKHMDTSGSMWIKVDTKPLTANRLWMGRKWPTPQYKAYREELLLKMPSIDNFPKPPFCIHYIFGLSNINQDLDNCLKGVNDALQERYLFNDRDIYKAVMEKRKVPKGCEFISFNIKSLADTEWEQQNE